jgi:hypothetical protein
MKKLMKVNIVIKGEMLLDVVVKPTKDSVINFEENKIPQYTSVEVDNDKLNDVIKKTIKTRDIGEYEDMMGVHIKLEDIVR